MAKGHAFAFECECGKFVVYGENGFTSFEYSEDEIEEFIEHCQTLEILVTSDGITESYGFCEWCELTVN
jgi:hypothetical protein